MPRGPYDYSSTSRAGVEGFKLGSQQAHDRRTREEDEGVLRQRDEQQSASALRNMILGKQYDAVAKEAAEALQGEQELEGINQVLGGDMGMAKRLGRVSGTPASESTEDLPAEPSTEAYQPFAGRGKGAGMIASLLKERMKEITQGDIAQSNAQSSADRLAAALQSRERNVDVQVRGANERSEAHRLAAEQRGRMLEEGRNRRQQFQIAFQRDVVEPGKNQRTGQMAGAISAAGRYDAIGRLILKAKEQYQQDSYMAQGVLQDPKASPQEKAAAQAGLDEWQRLLVDAQARLDDAGRSLQSISPTQPQQTPGGPGYGGRVIRGPDGTLRLQR